MGTRTHPFRPQAFRLVYTTHSPRPNQVLVIMHNMDRTKPKKAKGSKRKAVKTVKTRKTPSKKLKPNKEGSKEPTASQQRVPVEMQEQIRQLEARLDFAMTALRASLERILM